MDEFVVDDTDMSDVDFDNVSVGYGERLGWQQNRLYGRDIYDDNFNQKDIYRYYDHILKGRMIQKLI